MTVWRWAARAVLGALVVWLAAGLLLILFADMVDPFLRTLPVWFIGIDSAGSIPAQRVPLRVFHWLSLAGSVVGLFAPNWWRFAGLWFAASIAALTAFFTTEEFVLNAERPYLHLQGVLIGLGVWGLVVTVPLVALGLVRFVYAAGRRVFLGPVAGRRFMPLAGWLAIATLVALVAGLVTMVILEGSLPDAALRGGG